MNVVNKLPSRLVIFLLLLDVSEYVSRSSKFNATTVAGTIIDVNNNNNEDIPRVIDDGRLVKWTDLSSSRLNCNDLSSPITKKKSYDNNVSKSSSITLTGSDKPNENERLDSSSLLLNHLRLDASNEMLYATGINRLLQLDGKSLHVIGCVITGPKYDSPECHSSGCSSNYDASSTSSGVELKMIDNVNKILLIDSQTDSLIVCGSIRQGSCERYRLNDITADNDERKRLIPVAVAANDAHSSTYAFIGIERYNDWRGTSVLYVGTTYTGSGMYRDDVPSIATRNLHTMQIAEYSFTKQSLVRTDVKYRDTFLIDYLYGFNYSDYSYFVTLQKRSYLPGEEETGYISRIARVCVNDDNYDSYVEVTLECASPRRNNNNNNNNNNNGRSNSKKRRTYNDGDVNYNLIQDVKLSAIGEDLAYEYGVEAYHTALFASYSISDGYGKRPVNRSALCVHTMRDVERLFDDNIRMCFNGSAKYRNMPYMSGLIMDGNCPAPGTSGIIHNYCDVGLRLSGTVPIAAKSAIEFPNDLITSVTVTTAEAGTLCFLGTSEGILKKVLLNTPSDGINYENLVISRGNKILPDTAVSPSNDYIYLMTDSLIAKVKTHDCGQFTNCKECINSNDPYCGWCALEKRCTILRECDRATRNSARWLPFDTDRECITFDEKSPDSIPIDQVDSIILTIRRLPALPSGAKYECVFGDNEPMESTAVLFGLSCPTPSVQMRPKIPPGRDYVSVLLSLRSSETNKNFVSRNFSYFNCSIHDTCVRCTTSNWNCDWCLYDNKCIDEYKRCQHDAIVNGENNPRRQIFFNEIRNCPKLVKPTKRILIPHAISKEIVLSLEDIPKELSDYSEFSCKVSIEDTEKIVPATFNDNNTALTCHASSYSFKEDVAEYIMPVTAVWNFTYPIDTTNVTLYKCPILGSHRRQPDCSLCIANQEEYNCAWCHDKCRYGDQCDKPFSSDCPRPRIDMISPLSGPIEGGTLITIEGSNIGINEDQVMYKIRIGEIPCEIVEYHVSTKVVCRTGASAIKQHAKIMVGNRSGYTMSAVHFNYDNVVLKSITPSVGPVSGGTQLAIIGDNLIIGDNVTAHFDELECVVNIYEATNSRIICTTPPVYVERNISVFTLTVDNAKRTLTSNPFTYSIDPTVVEIIPLSSFASGGRTISVHGTNLDIIQKPEMIVYNVNLTVVLNKTVCIVLNSNQMKCPSPSVNEELDRTPADTVNLQVGFIMDSVKSVRNLREHHSDLPSIMTYTKDPKYYAFFEDIKQYNNDTLSIQGENLNMASDSLDVTVTIGIEYCNVTSFTNTQLNCTPPKTEPLPTDEMNITTHTNLPLVVVRVGDNLRFQLGYLRYKNPNKSYWWPSKKIIIIVLVLIVLICLLTLIALALLIFRHKKNKTSHHRIQRRVHFETDALKSRKSQHAPAQTQDAADLVVHWNDTLCVRNENRLQPAIKPTVHLDLTDERRTPRLKHCCPSRPHTVNT